MPIDQFFMVIEDEDQKHFTVEGPMIDDRIRIGQLWDTRKGGRAVRCYHVSAAGVDRATLIAETSQRTGFTYVDDIGL